MWITLELCALTMLHSSGALRATAAIVLAIILLILLIADMACYLAYYHLPPMPAFIDGTTPLIAVTVFSVVPEFLRTLVFARPRGDDQFADCTFSPSLDMSR